MCILYEKIFSETDPVECYKVVSRNPAGVLLPIFSVPLTRVYNSASDKELKNSWTNAVESPYDGHNRVRVQAFATEEEASCFFYEVNHQKYNIPFWIKRVYLWKCTLFPPVYWGNWDMMLGATLYSGHEIRFNRKIRKGRNI